MEAVIAALVALATYLVVRIGTALYVLSLSARTQQDVKFNLNYFDIVLAVIVGILVFLL